MPEAPGAIRLDEASGEVTMPLDYYLELARYMAGVDRVRAIVGETIRADALGGGSETAAGGSR